MIFDIILSVCLVGAVVYAVYIGRKLERVRDQMINLALKVADTSERIDRVDDSTGKAIYDLSQKFETFNTLYGEAAIEEKREAAKAEKAWAEGISNIMSFGSQFQGRGGKE